MEIYGLGLVAACMFIGTTVGSIVGNLLGVSGDVGGVGFSMLLLILISNKLESKGKGLSEGTGRGIQLLSSLYIPITVAMSARQDVVSAFKGGAAPLLAGVIATVAGLYLVPVISKLAEPEYKPSFKKLLEGLHD
ncbi:MAG: malonate transporter subunit MadL [Tissierellaceae bacterium]|nr:malonate transporter subunit MadL [Tissierellaceae bacterium]